jgi:EAL domain-containing protein (putative c-di-GMP-specific phosphodiesterase class I)
MVKSIVQPAHSLGMAPLAEGIEREAFAMSDGEG